MIIGVENLLNSSSKAMNVNGSQVNVAFSYLASAPTAIYGLTIVLLDEGTTDMTDFGAIAGSLTNGILFKVIIDEENKDIMVVRDNADLVTRFSHNHFGSSAVLSLLGTTTPSGFGNSNNVLVGKFIFPNPIILSANDSIAAVVRDNLTGLNLLNVACIIGVD